MRNSASPYFKRLSQVTMISIGAIICFFTSIFRAGIGASRQTGWTGLFARCIDLFAHVSPKDILTGEGADSPMARTVVVASII